MGKDKKAKARGVYDLREVEGLRKPDSMLYQRACDRLSVAPAECLYVGDGNYTSLEAASWQGQRIVALKELMDLEKVFLLFVVYY